MKDIWISPPRFSRLREPPAILTYWDATPPSDPHQMAVEASARLNTIAAALRGCSAFSAFLSYWAGGSRGSFEGRVAKGKSASDHILLSSGAEPGNCGAT